MAAPLPLRTRQAHDELTLRVAARRERRLVDALVAELLGDAQRRLVEVERARDRGDSAEAGEAELEHRLAHLRPQPATLALAPQPRPRLELAPRGELGAPEVLAAGRAPVEEHAGRERPSLRPPLRPRAEVILDRGVDELLTGTVRPRNPERHLVRRMHAAICEA